MIKNILQILITGLVFHSCAPTRQHHSYIQQDKYTDETEIFRVDQEIKSIESLRLNSGLGDKKEDGFWSTGLLIGRYHHLPETGNFFIQTDLNFNLGAGIRQPDQLFYTPKTMPVTLYRKNIRSEIGKLPKNTGIVFRYIRRYPSDPLHWPDAKANYYIYSASRMTESFRETQSFYNYGMSFVNHADIIGNQTAGGFKYGRIVEIARWGAFGKSCTATLHTGQEFPGENALMFDVNMLSEGGCQYLEDLAVSGIHSWFAVSSPWLDIFQSQRHMIEQIWAGETPPDQRTEPSQTQTPATRKSDT